MRGIPLIAIVSTAMAASAAEAPFSMGLTSALFGSTEVGGVDEVDTYPAGLPEVEPEVVSPPLRPGEEFAPPPEPQPVFQPPPYQPPPLQPPVLQPLRPAAPAGAWQYRTVLSGGHTTKGLYDIRMERDHFEMKFLFKKTTWDGSVPFDHFEGHNGVGYLAIGGTPPGFGWFEDDTGFMEGEQDGPRGALKLYLSNELSVEGYAIGLFSYDDFSDFNVNEGLFGGKVGLHLKNGLSLWYGREEYTINENWGGSYQDWSYEWTMYGVDWLFGARNQHFKVSFCKRDEPTEAFFFMGPIEETKIEFSWFPTKKIKLSSGFKTCPDSEDDSTFFSAKWDASRTISLGAYRETSGGLSEIDIATFWAALRF